MNGKHCEDCFNYCKSQQDAKGYWQTSHCRSYKLIQTYNNGALETKPYSPGEVEEMKRKGRGHTVIYLPVAGSNGPCDMFDAR